MLFTLGKYVLDIDVDKTRDLYINAETISCPCQGCRNYLKWSSSLLEEPKYLLESMGVMLEKPAEVHVYNATQDGSLLYGGFYHLCGKIVHGKDSKDLIDDHESAFGEMQFDLTENFYVAFTKDIALLEDDFPEPVVQMEIVAIISFLLQEILDY